MATRTRKKALYLKAEAVYGVEAGLTDGSDYTAAKCLTLDLLSDTKAVLDISYATGRNRISSHEMGADGAQVTFTTPVQGLVSFAGDGTSAGSIPDDWFDMLLTNVFGEATTTTGEGLTVTATASSLAVDTDGFTNQDMVAVQHADFDNGVANWRRLSGTVSPYLMDRNLSASPTGDETAFGTKMYRPASPGASLSACFDLDGTMYLCLGGRITSMSIAMPAGELAVLSVTMDFDSKNLTGTHTELPTISTFPGTPCKGLLSAFSWEGDEYATKSVSIDFGITAQPDSNVIMTNGRSDIIVLQTDPTVTVETAWTDGLETMFRGGVTEKLSIQIGSGVSSDGALNTCSFFAEGAQLTTAGPTDDGGRLRNALTFKIVDTGIFSGSIISEYFQFSRA